MSTPVNQLILMSDEHSRKIMGCYGDPLVKTPNLDRLAERGVRFSAAYTPCPICVPARAAFATGKYCHSTRHWDNATPYTGAPKSWGHALQENGVRVGSIGKLHYRNETDDVGFDFQENPIHVVKGVGDVLGSVRDPLPKRWKAADMAVKIGPGETGYTAYDRDIADRAVAWLEERGKEGAGGEPWTVFVSLVCPHFPLISPPEFFEMYDGCGRAPSKPADEPEHGWLAQLRESYVNYGEWSDEKTRTALQSYYGLTTFMDSLMGRILDALDAAGLTETTRVVYTSDHGDNAGERGLWGKSTMFEESAGVPLIMAGPGIPEGRVCNTPVNLVDLYPTILSGAGVGNAPEDRPGRSLVEIANEPDDRDRVVFSEYHAAGAPSGCFMIRKGRWKFIYYVGFQPQLFDLENDPEELADLGGAAEFEEVRDDLERELRKVCDPEQVDRNAKSDQMAIVTRHGGVDAVVAQGGFGATPPPGEKPQYS